MNRRPRTSLVFLGTVAATLGALTYCGSSSEAAPPPAGRVTVYAHSNLTFRVVGAAGGDYTVQSAGDRIATQCGPGKATVKRVRCTSTVIGSTNVYRTLTGDQHLYGRPVRIPTPAPGPSELCFAWYGGTSSVVCPSGYVETS